MIKCDINLEHINTLLNRSTLYNEQELGPSNTTVNNWKDIRVKLNWEYKGDKTFSIPVTFSLYRVKELRFEVIMLATAMKAIKSFQEKGLLDAQNKN